MSMQMVMQCVDSTMRQMLRWLALEIGGYVLRKIVDYVTNAVRYLWNKISTMLFGVEDASPHDKKVVKDVVTAEVRKFPQGVKDGLRGKLQDPELEKKLTSQMEQFSSQITSDISAMA